MKIFCVALFLLVTKFNTTLSQGIPEAAKTNNNNEFVYEKVSITDPDKIVTDLYVMVTNVRDYIRRQSSIDKDEVIFNALPDAWEGKMKQVTDKSNWPSIKKYNAWRIAASPDYDVLQIKADENTDMPEGFKPQKTFYIVIKKSGVGKFNGNGKTGSDNCALLSSIYAASKDKFAGIKGKLINSSVGNNYEANIPKAGAEKIYINDFFGVNQIKAEFGTYATMADANEQFLKLVDNFKACSNYDVRKVKDKENTYEIVLKDDPSIYPTIILSIENNVGQLRNVLSMFGF